MTREEFIEELEEKDYPYKIEGDKIVVTYIGSIWLNSLTSLPSGIEFRNKTIPFLLETNVHLESLEILPPGVVFRNKGDVYLKSLKIIPSGVQFKNEGDVWLNSLIGGRFADWEGSIEGVESNRLLNEMVSEGLLDRNI